MKTVDKVLDWADDTLLQIKMASIMGLTKMGYAEEDAADAIDIFLYLDYKLLWRRFKARRLKK